jgi:hypothetical protein
VNRAAISRSAFPLTAKYDCRRSLIPGMGQGAHTRDQRVIGPARRPTAQAEQFRSACVAFAQEISRRGAALLVLGDERSKRLGVGPGWPQGRRTAVGQCLSPGFDSPLAASGA